MQMIIASRLVDGRVVFMGERGKWVPRIEDGLVVAGDADDADATRLMSEARQAARDNTIVDPYFINVLLDAGSPRPAHVREAIRAFGPSVRTDFAGE